jgi:tetratricopeptide (TPR) repeat protein
LAIESRTVEQWIDEGSLRSEATEAAGRARAGTTIRRRPSRPGQIDAETAAVIRAGAHDARHADKLIERLAQAQQALDRERFDDARRLATPLLRDVPGVAAAHEVVGLAAYRAGRWKQAVGELEAAQRLHPAVELLPVLADGYRALRRWNDVARVWADLRAASPAQEILAEGRIVAAGAEADRGDLQGAIRTMAKAKQMPRRVRDHHLRQWYVLGDLYDRAGDPLEAAHWFDLVARHDAEFVDVADRLRALGR